MDTKSRQQTPWPADGSNLTPTQARRARRRQRDWKAGSKIPSCIPGVVHRLIRKQWPQRRRSHLSRTISVHNHHPAPVLWSLHRQPLDLAPPSRMSPTLRLSCRRRPALSQRTTHTTARTPTIRPAWRVAIRRAHRLLCPPSPSPWATRTSTHITTSSPRLDLRFRWMSPSTCPQYPRAIPSNGDRGDVTVEWRVHRLQRPCALRLFLPCLQARGSAERASIQTVQRWMSSMERLRQRSQRG